MSADFDAKLATLAAEILRQEALVYDQGDLERWLGISSMLAGWKAGMIGGAEATGAVLTVTAGFPVVTGALPNLPGAPAEAAGTVQLLGTDAGVTLRKVFHVPGRLPGLRLPAADELTKLARSAPVMAQLEELARWLGRDGR